MPHVHLYADKRARKARVFPTARGTFAVVFALVDVVMGFFANHRRRAAANIAAQNRGEQAPHAAL